MSHIPYGRQDISNADKEAVMAVLASDWLTQGPAIEEFERQVARYAGVKYAVAVNSATSALHIACLAAGLKKNDYLWTSPNTFVASANCALYCGADVDFVDIDNNTYNMSTKSLAEKLASTSRDKLPKAVVPVHFSGQSCDMEAIAELRDKYGFTIIEDASHAIGGSYKGKKVGACQYSDMTVFSFHPVKIITTAEGGMVLTNRDELYEKLQLFRSHGITRQSHLMEGESHGAWYYQQVELGFNYRMTDMQAALGISQLKRIDEFIARRVQIAERYNQELKDLPVVLPHQDEATQSAWHLYVLRIKPEYKKTRRQVFEELRSMNIGVQVHYIPVHTQPYYQKLGFKHGDFPVAEAYYKEAISIPMYARLTDEEQSIVINALKQVIK